MTLGCHGKHMRSCFGIHIPYNALPYFIDKANVQLFIACGYII